MMALGAVANGGGTVGKGAAVDGDWVTCNVVELLSVTCNPVIADAEFCC